MKTEQILRMLKVFIVTTIIILISEVFFSSPVINNSIRNWIITNNGEWAFYVIIWVICFLQTNLVQIPAIVILQASVLCGVNVLSVAYISVVLSAYMIGCIFTYWLGLKFGSKGVKWIAGNEKDFNKWSKFINKKGKLIYFASVLLPIFPDDLLCLVAGAVKMNFVFFSIANLIGRGVGLVVMLITLQSISIISGGFPILLIVWVVALIAEIITYYVLKNRSSKNEEVDDNNSTV